MLPLIVAVPIEAPWIIPFAERAPSGIVTVRVSTSTTDESLLISVTSTPPGGAASGAMVTGMLAVWPNGTFSVLGRLIRFRVTSTLRVPSE